MTQAAATISIWICNDVSCQGVHIIWRNENDENIAEAVVPLTRMPRFINDLNDAVKMMTDKVN
jgi:hypothetical protein